MSWRMIGFILLALLLVPGVALADVAPPPAPTQVFPTDQVWVLIAGALAPLAAYVINYVGPHTDEKVKGIIQGVVAAIAGGIMQAVTAGHVGFNNVTLQFVITAVFAAAAAHSGFYKVSGINVALGGGRNKPG